MRELPTIEQVRIILKAAGMDEYGDGDIVANVLVGYAEPGYGSDDVVIVLGNWNDKDPRYGWNVKTLSGDRFPWESKPPKVKADYLPSRLARVLEAAGAELEWSDEWTECTHCYRAIRTEPDSYSWTPSFAWLNECEPVCAECLRANPEWIIDDYVNDASKALTVLGETELTSLGFAHDDGRYASGWYGQEDNPAAILETLLKFSPEGTEVVFTVDSVGQFEARFSAWVRTPADND